jgi:hypothetical protein
VNWHKASGNWIARITVRGKQHHLGTYEEEEEEARAYDMAARLHFGDYARTNLV